MGANQDSARRIPRDAAALRGRQLLLMMIILLAGCTADRWRYQEWVPYGEDHEVPRADLQQLAASACPITDLLTPRFASDGCSMVPDGELGGCCVEHDLAYWCGGSREARLAADRRFRQCVINRSNGLLGWTMFLGVRLGGHPLLPFPWRWGYGRRWRAGYWGTPESPIPEQPPKGWEAAAMHSQPAGIGLLSGPRKDASLGPFEKNQE